MLLMQAAAEYALRTAAQNVKNSSLPPIFGCPVSSEFVSCFNHAHPVATIVIGVGIAGILIRFIASR
jgi:hypothetical protein